MSNESGALRYIVTKDGDEIYAFPVGSKEHTALTRNRKCFVEVIAKNYMDAITQAQELDRTRAWMAVICPAF